MFLVFDAMYLFYFEIAFVLCACVALSYGLVMQARANRCVSSLESALSGLGHGVAFFDEEERFIQANGPAKIFLPDVFAPDMKAALKQKGALKIFFDYVYDHAVECDDQLLSALGRIAQRRETIGFREVIMAADNRWCLVEAQKTPEGGTNIVLIDIGDIKTQEELMRRLNQYNHELHQAVQATTSGILVTKPQERGSHIAVFANTAFCEIFDVLDNDIIGQNMDWLFSSIEDEHVIEEIFDLARMGEKGSVEVSFKDAKGDVRWYDLRLTPVKNFKGDLELFVSVLNDTTEVKTREAELSKNQRLEALGRLSAGVAHDFNNVLSIIDGYARLTSRSIGNVEKAQENLERILTASERGAALVKKMLFFSRHEIIDDEVVDLGDAVRDQELLMRPLMDASIKCTVLADKRPMFVECSEDQITQILMNLVVNARDAMRDGGVLFIETRICPEGTLPDALKPRAHNESFASLLVSDTGEGIAPDILERIYDPFFTTKDQGKGTGLGLSMVYGVIKRIGGHIEIESRVGKGTVFTIYFPLTTQKPKTIHGDIEDISSIRFDGYTVLIAEDEPDLLRLLENILQELGMHVLPAQNGDEALAMQDQYDGHIDLLITDIVMPELNGVELAAFIKEFRPETDVIFMSGYPANGQMARVELPDEEVFVAKPLKRDDLVRLILGKLQRSADGTGDSVVRAPRWSTTLIENITNNEEATP